MSSKYMRKPKRVSLSELHQTTSSRIRLISPAAGTLPYRLHFTQTNQYGTVIDYDDFVAARACHSQAAGIDESADVILEFDAKAERFIREHHKRTVLQFERTSSYAFDFYPHHVSSWPSEFAEFYLTEPRQIVAYHLVLRAVCLKVEGGHVSGNEIASSSRRVSVR